MEKKEPINDNENNKEKTPENNDIKGISSESTNSELVEEIIEKLPENERKIIQAVMMESRFSGPIPPPELLSGYQSILPDAPERILRMAEAEQAHRHGIETVMVDKSIKQAGRGQVMGFCLSAMFGVISLVLGLSGHEWLAGVLGTTTVVSLAIIFVLNQRPSKNDIKIDDVEHGKLSR